MPALRFLFYVFVEINIICVLWRRRGFAGFRRLTPGQPVGLKHASMVITLTKVIKDAGGKVTELEVTSASLDTATKPKVCGLSVCVLGCLCVWQFS